MKKIAFFINHADIDKNNGVDYKDFYNWCKYFGYDFFVNENNFQIEEKTLQKLNIDANSVVSENEFENKIKTLKNKVIVLIQNNESGFEELVDYIFSFNNTNIKNSHIPVEKVFIINNYSAVREILSNLDFLI